MLTYAQYDSDGRKGLQLFRSLNMKQQQAANYSGRLTAGAKKRLTKAITLMVQGTRRRWIFNPVSKRNQLHQLSFVTLTVAGGNEYLDGKTAYKKLLSGFLQWMRKTKGINTYIWKAELQKSGQLHYHITCPDFIHYREIRDKWNDLQYRAGLLEHHFNKYGNYDPNSTDIHTVHKMNDAAAYMVKEIAKQCQNSAALGGKVWDCSANLSQAKYYTQDFKEDHFRFCEMAVEEKLATKVEGERFCIYRFNQQVEEHLLTAEELGGFKTWLKVIRASITYSDPPAP